VTCKMKKKPEYFRKGLEKGKGVKCHQNETLRPFLPLQGNIYL